ncbi:(Fe-S)-binding protein [Cystobacter fuscus]
MGLIMFWARAAMLAPGLVNLLTQHSPTKELLQKLGGLTTKRPMPRFAPESFQRWVGRQRPVPRHQGHQRVLLWPDTFNNHFFPETAASALEVLEDAGFEVVVPQGFLCCGRPLYDFGMLPTAKWMLRRTVERLRPYIEEGVPLVGLEPSCVSVFRDELRNLFPDWGLATQLRRQTFLFSDFLGKYAKDWRPPRMEKKAVVHGHCHHKSLFKLNDEKGLLGKLGLDYRYRRRAAVAWRARSVSRRERSTRCPRRWASACCCPRSVRRPRTHSSSRMASAAGSRSPRTPTARPCTWRRSCGWRRCTGPRAPRAGTPSAAG